MPLLPRLPAVHTHPHPPQILGIGFLGGVHEVAALPAEDSVELARVERAHTERKELVPHHDIIINDRYVFGVRNENTEKPLKVTHLHRRSKKVHLHSRGLGLQERRFGAENLEVRASVTHDPQACYIGC